MKKVRRANLRDSVDYMGTQYTAENQYAQKHNCMC